MDNTKKGETKERKRGNKYNQSSKRWSWKISFTNGFSVARSVVQKGQTGWKLFVPWGRGIRDQYLKQKETVKFQRQTSFLSRYFFLAITAYH